MKGGLSFNSVFVWAYFMQVRLEGDLQPMKGIYTALLAFVALVGATDFAFANKRIPITFDTRWNCLMALKDDGTWEKDSGNGNGSIELAELKDFLADKVGYQARRRYSRTQIPEVMGNLDRVMTASLDPRFSFGDPDIENPLPRNQRPAERSFRAQDQSVTQTNQQTTASQDQKDTDDIPEIIKLLFKNSKQNEKQSEYYND